MGFYYKHKEKTTKNYYLMLNSGFKNHPTETNLQRRVLMVLIEKVIMN
jgi:hypothetical protein